MCRTKGRCCTSAGASLGISWADPRIRRVLQLQQLLLYLLVHGSGPPEAARPKEEICAPCQEMSPGRDGPASFYFPEDDGRLGFLHPQSKGKGSVAQERTLAEDFRVIGERTTARQGTFHEPPS